MVINITTIQNITTSEQFIELAHNISTIPAILTIYISFVVIFLLFGVITLKGHLSGKFWAMYLSTITITGGITLAIYLLPLTFQNFIDFLFA